MRRKNIPRYHSYSPTCGALCRRLKTSRALTQPYGRTYRSGAPRTPPWARQLGSDPTKKYRLRAHTTRALSASLPFPAFFVIVFIRFIITRPPLFVNRFSKFPCFFLQKSPKIKNKNNNNSKKEAFLTKKDKKAYTESRCGVNSLHRI